MHPTSSQTPPDAATARSPRELGKNTSRRPHRKSRLGCNNCKKRRVKVGAAALLSGFPLACDELQPTCSYCRTRSLSCQYPPKPKPLAAEDTNNGQRRSAVVVVSSIPNVDDLELLFNFTNSTELPKLAFDWPFLLHGMFALSSMQLARFRREGSRRSSEFYASQATYHWHQGLRMAGALLPQMNEENCHALYAFAIISCYFSLASGPRPGDFLMFGNGTGGTGGTADGSPDWCLLLRGVGPISEPFWPSIERGPVSPLTTNVMRNLSMLAAVKLDEDEAEPFRNLRAYIVDADAERPDELAVHLYAINTISQCYSALYDKHGVPNKDASELVMYTMFALTESTAFLRLLQSRDPSALIVFAHFVALFKETNFGWISHGWAPHLMGGVYAALTSKHRIHISWPMKSLGWIPPE
ncbi:hypothetical protein MAPG_01405 [Magnaporthiopsis poae ATCC 64411]|uniref:Zn(2)-C6 fungal-type domain-containing protein n=1 Tax=Magnaporthiopsis poae (strain ATCC 64411 / 73-15) TaxID=644358 RepID=A0A0C4DNL3_MAGP6|nr:hypothetical protein MAPG_01405 [Magnaporthiopsis poae ATCC 64411]